MKKKKKCGTKQEDDDLDDLDLLFHLVPLPRLATGTADASTRSLFNDPALVVQK